MDDTIIVPLSEKIAGNAAEILREAFPWCYGGNDADKAIKRMLSKKRISLAAIVRIETGLCVAGLVGAIPQYGVTGWELHPLAVLKEYRGRGSDILHTATSLADDIYVGVLKGLENS